MLRFTIPIVLLVTLVSVPAYNYSTAEAQSGMTASSDGDAMPLNGERVSTVQAAQQGCSLAPTQYTIQVDPQDSCGTVYIEIHLSSAPGVNLYVRHGQKVVAQDGQIVADYKDESESSFKSIRLAPPYKGGIYYIAVSNCGAQPASFTLRLAMAVADYFGPFIKEVTMEGKKLIVSGCMFDIDAVVLINGEDQPTKFTADGDMPTLIVKKANKKIRPGETVLIQVENSHGFGFPSAPFTFTRGAE